MASVWKHGVDTYSVTLCKTNVSASPIIQLPMWHRFHSFTMCLKDRTLEEVSMSYNQTLVIKSGLLLVAIKQLISEVPSCPALLLRLKNTELPVCKQIISTWSPPTSAKTAKKIKCILRNFQLPQTLK